MRTIEENRLPPLISIIVPVFNGEKIIGDCIDSLLIQKYPKERYEIILVDNGSTDRTKAECIMRCKASGLSNAYASIPLHQSVATALCHTPLHVYYVFEPIRGSYAARNTGLKYAKGNIIAFTDADCIADKEWLQNAVNVFDDESIGCVSGEIKSVHSQNFVEQYLARREWLKQDETTSDFFLTYAKTANAFYRKEVFSKIGLFEGRWVSGGDADFSWRMQIETRYKFKFESSAVIYHRHRSSTKDMFNQAVRWGMGYRLLSQKYRDKLPNPTLKQSLWTLQRIFQALIMVAAFHFQNKDRIPIEKRERYLDFISSIAWEIGKIYPIRLPFLNSVANKFIK